MLFQTILIIIGAKAGPKPIGPRVFGPRAGVIYSRLFKYIQQHTSGFTENSWAQHLLMPVLIGVLLKEYG